MKKSIVICFLIFIIFGHTVFAKENTEFYKSEELVEIESNEIKYKIPLSWCETRESPDDFTTYYQAESMIIMFQSVESAIEDFDSVSDWEKETYGNILLGALKGGFSSYEEISNSFETISGLTSYRFKANVFVENINYILDGAMFLHNYRCYIFAMLAETESNLDYSSDFQSLLESVTFTDLESGKNENDGTKTEILFRDIPWGTSFTDVSNSLSELGLWGVSGDIYKTMSIDDIVLGDYKGIDFEYTDINIIGNSSNSEINVAGYTTTDVTLYFAYIPKDGVLNKTEDESAFYGAQYVFEPKNLVEMSSDLKNKLSGLYGEPDEEKTETDWLDIEYTYTFWKGANDTEVVLKTLDSSNDTSDIYDDEIVISYVWLKGDELLQNASDILAQEAIGQESSVYGNDSSDGL